MKVHSYPVYIVLAPDGRPEAVYSEYERALWLVNFDTTRVITLRLDNSVDPLGWRHADRSVGPPSPQFATLAQDLLVEWGVARGLIPILESAIYEVIDYGRQVGYALCFHGDYSWDPEKDYGSILVGRGCRENEVLAGKEEVVHLRRGEAVRRP
jgi:hypothetical protein